MKHKDTRRRDTARIELERELLPLIIALVLFIAASAVSAAYVNLPKWLTLVMGIVPVAAAAFSPLCKAGRKLLGGKVLSYDMLIILACIGTSCMQNFTEAFFVLVAFDVGSCFEHIFAGKNHKRTPYLAYLRPEYVAVEQDGKMNMVSPERIRPGTVMTVGKNELIPLDGIIVDGSSSVDASAYTGDRNPIDVGVGNDVVSGCVNLGSPLRIRVTGLYNNSTLMRTADIVENAPKSVSKREARFARISKIFTPVVIVLAIALTIIPSIITGDWLEWTHRALIFLASASFAAPLIVSSMAYFAGLSTAVGRGIVIRGKNELEKLAASATVVMDKTGTVTEGSFSVTGVEPKGISSADLVSLAAAAESYSNHPIALSLRRASTTHIDPEHVKNVRELAGRGVEAEVYGRKVLVGNTALMNTNGIKCDRTDRHLSVVHVAAAGIYYGYIIIDDRVKDGAKDAVRDLYSLGIEKAVLLTSDTDRVGKAVGRALGVSDVMTELMPEDKVVAVGELLREKHTGKLAFVGDALSDAAVLRRADVGVAMGALSAEAAASKSGILIMSDDIGKLPLALRICKVTSNAVRLGFLLAALVKLAVLLLAAFGSIGMIAAVAADTLVFMLTVYNAYRIYKVK
jgi:Zn2+/Cd2+-exporting ATPase